MAWRGIWRGRGSHLSPDVGGLRPIGESVESLLRHPSQLLLRQGLKKLLLSGLHHGGELMGEKTWRVFRECLHACSRIAVKHVFPPADYEAVSYN